MVAASLILAALLGAPFSPRAVVPVNSAAVAASVQPAAFNPTATARAHVATITITPAVDGTATTVVESETGAIVETLATAAPVTAGTPVTYTWAANDAADGTYGVHTSLTDAQGVVSQSVVPVTVDTTAPTVSFGGLRPALTKRGPVALRAGTDDPSGASSIRIEVSSQTDVPIGSTDVAVGADGASGTTDWNLRVRKRLLLPGVFRLRATITDGAGNIGTSAPRLLRVDRAVTTRIIYSLPDAGNVIALTFDDCGSNRDLQRIVTAFRAAKAQATFFCNGVNVRDNASSRCAGRTAVERTVRAAGDAGFAWTVLWDVDPSDYLTPPPGELVRRVVQSARKGSIVVMHANSNTAATVPQLIRAVRAQGLEPKSLDQMFGASAYLAPLGS